MPLARTHDIITVATGAALAPATYAVLLNQGQSPETSTYGTALLVGAHLMSGIMFSPDLDIDSAIDNRWGPFFWIWRPYMWAVPHGSPLFSHGLIISPLLRLMYFGGVGILVYIGLAWVAGLVGIAVPDYASRVVNFLLALPRTHLREVLAVLIGFVTGGAAHTIADWLVVNHRGHRHHPRLR
jgi:uncharacterized metal-binding protein